MKKMIKKNIHINVILFLILNLFLVPTLWAQYEGSGFFEQITTLEELEADTYYVFYGINITDGFTGAMSNDFAEAGRLNSDNVTLTSAGIFNPAEENVWLVAGNSEDGYTVYNEEAGVYAEIVGNTTGSFELNDPATHAYEVTVEEGNFMFRSDHPDANNRMISIFRTDWRSYTTSFANTLHLYKYAGEAEEPILFFAPPDLSIFAYNLDAGPAASQILTIYGLNLNPVTGDITVDATGTNFEVSTDDENFHDSVTLPYTEGELSEQDVYVRLVSGLEIDSYSDKIEISGGGADPVEVDVSGDVSIDYKYTETFENYPETGNSYDDGDFEGVLGNTWFYVNARGNPTIDAPTPLLQNNTDATLNTELTGGISEFSFDYMQAFSTNVNLEVHINDELVATVTSDGEQSVVKNSGNIIVEDVNGDFTIEFKQGTGPIGGQVAIDNFSWNPYVLSRNIAGAAGWRMLSLPVENVTIADLMEINELAGFPGANDFYAGRHDITGFNYEQTNAQNFYFFDPAMYDAGESSSGSAAPGWVSPTGPGQEIEPGRGFIWFFYDDLPAGDSPASSPLPTRLAFDIEHAPDGEVSIPLTKESEMDHQSAWNLVGNPFASAIDPNELDQLNQGLASSAAQIWNPAEGTFVTRNFTAEPNDIAIGQAFFVQNEEQEAFTFPVSAQSEGSPPFYRQSKKKEERPVIIRFRLEGEHDTYDAETVDEAISLFISEEATSGWDRFDVQKLTPLSAPFATLSFVGDRNGRKIYKAQESQPLDLAGEVVEIPVNLTKYEMSGDFVLKWEMPDRMPESWNLIFADHQAGKEISLLEASEYRFRSSGQMKNTAASLQETLSESFSGTGRDVNPSFYAEASGAKPDKPQKGTLSFGKAFPMARSLVSKAEGGDLPEYRFTLILSEDVTGSESPSSLPGQIELAQNYPNPFNPVTVLSYGLPEESHIRLAVYDITGRMVTLLVDEHHAPGRYEVSWDATRQASGVYIYRLEAGGETLTRRMTLVK